MLVITTVLPGSVVPVTTVPSADTLRSSGGDGGWVSMLILNAGDMPPVPDWFVAVAVKACSSSDNGELEVHVQLPLLSASTLMIIVPLS